MNLSAPLLWRQLALEAAQGRTFWVRPLFGLAVALALVLASGSAGALLLSGEPLEVGSGRALFDALMLAAFIAIYLVLPALVAPAVAAEEERGTLDLLTIAGIGPLALILQLSGARLAMALTLGLAALPLAAMAYAGGGVSDQRLCAAGLALLAAAVQVTACAAAAGSRRLPAVQATLAAYRDVVVHLGILLPLGCFIALLLTHIVGYELRGAPWAWYRSLADSPSTPSLVLVLLGALPPVVASVWWHLRQARRNLARRAVQLPPGQQFLMDRWRSGFNWQRSARRWRLRLGLDRHELPDTDPVAWRSQLHTPLVGERVASQRLRFLGCLLPILVLVVFFNTMTVLAHRGHGSSMAGVLVVADLIFWIILLLAVHTAAAGLPRERAAGTREVLAATPLAGPAVASGFIGGARLLLLRSWPVYVGILGYAHLIEWDGNGLLLWLVAAAATLGWAGCAAWGGLYVGARRRTPLGAGAAALVVAVLACLLPWLAGRVLAATGMEGLQSWLQAMSPLWLSTHLHFEGERTRLAALLPGTVAACVWFALWALLRWRCRARMDAWLERAP